MRKREMTERKMKEIERERDMKRDVRERVTRGRWER